MANETTNISVIPNQERIHQLFWMYLNRPATLAELDVYGNLNEQQLLNDLAIMKENAATEKANAEARNQALIANGMNRNAVFLDPQRGAFFVFNSDIDGAGPATNKTVWWAQPNNNTMRPILSETAYNNLTGGRNMADDMRNGTINSVPVEWLGSGYALSGFKLLPYSEGVQDNGTYISSSSVNVGALTNLYGKQPLDQNYVASWTNDNVMGFIKNFLTGDRNYNIDSNFLNNVLSNPDLLGLYTAATLYGGYSMADVAKDIKRRYLVSQGNTDLSNLKTIDENQDASTYYQTTDYKLANTDPTLSLPAKLAGIDIGVLENPVFKMPKEVFEVLVPPLNPNTPEGKAEIEKIQAGMYDIVSAQLDAKTERERIIAQGMYDDYKKEIERKYDIQLSDDAMTAWNQLGAYFDKLGQRGILDSGITNKAVDEYLRGVRLQDKRLREDKLTTEEKAEYEYLTKYGTPEQINALPEDKKIKYGFKPTAEMSSSLSKDKLKELYPTATPERIDEIYNEMFDKYGNLKSDLYTNLYAKKFGTAESALPVNTGMGLKASKEAFQLQEATRQKLAEEEKAYKEYTGAEIGEKAPAKTDTTTGQNTTGSTTGSSTSNVTANQKPLSSLNTPAYDWEAEWQKVNLSPIPEFNSQWGANYNGGDRVNWALAHRKNIFEAGRELLGRPLTATEVNQRLQQSPDINFIKGEFSSSPESQKYKSSLGGL